MVEGDVWREGRGEGRNVADRLAAPSPAPSRPRFARLLRMRASPSRPLPRGARRRARRFLSLRDERMFYSGLAIGHMDEAHRINRWRTGGAEVPDFAVFEGLRMAGPFSGGSGRSARTVGMGHTRNLFATAILALTLLAGAYPSPASAACLSAAETRQAVASGRAVPLSAALQREGIAGKVVNVRLCESGGGHFYDVKILQPRGQLRSVRIPAN